MGNLRLRVVKLLPQTCTALWCWCRDSHQGLAGSRGRALLNAAPWWTGRLLASAQRTRLSCSLPSGCEWGALGSLTCKANVNISFEESTRLNYDPSVVSAWALGQLLNLSWPQFPFLGNEELNLMMFKSSPSLTVCDLKLTGIPIQHSRHFGGKIILLVCTPTV